MEISVETRIAPLLAEFPFLVDFLVGISDKYQNLRDPVLRAAVAEIATMKEVAAMGEVDLADLLARIAAEIGDKGGVSVTVVTGSDGRLPAGIPVERLETLKGIIRDLHAGGDMEMLKERFRRMIVDVSPSEIAELEQQLIDDGLPVSEVKRLCDVHVEVFKESLGRRQIPRPAAGHPVDNLMRENRAAEVVVGNLQRALDTIGDPPDEAAFTAARDELAGLLEKLADIDLHYLRKENQLFPALEASGVLGPSRVMWGIHDEIRDQLKKVRRQVAESKTHELVSTLPKLLTAIRDMVYKEDNILFPMALEKLSEDDWAKVAAGEDEIGYAWIEPVPPAIGGAAGAVAAVARSDALTLDTGVLSPEQVNLLLKHLPVDITFVDEDDRVAYFSSGSERIFARSPGIIGRKVQNCHPPDTVHVVNRILEALRSGERDSAEFWIDLHGRFVDIRYFAVRDSEGTYRGCIEVSQDVTGIRGLEGQRRLLDWA